MNSKGLIYIIIGALLEGGWAYGLKHSTHLLEWGLTIAGMVISFAIFSKAVKYVGASLAYVLYTGLGTLFVVLADVGSTFINGGAVNFVQLFFIATLTAGIVIIKGAK